MAELKIHQVKMPDGEVVFLEGPVGSSQEEMQGFILSERQAAQKATPSDLAPGINADRLQQRIEAKAGKPVSTPLLDTIQPENKDDSMMGAVGQVWSSLSPGQQLGVAGAATGLGLAAGYKAKGLKDRFFSPEEKPMKVQIVGGEQSLPSAAASAEAEMQRAWSQKYPGTDFNKVKADLGLEGVKLSPSDYNYIEKAYQQRASAGQVPSAPTAAPQAPAAPPTPEAPVTTAAPEAPVAAPETTAAPSERNVNGVRMTEAQYQYYINEAPPGASPAQAVEEFNAKSATPEAPKTPTAAAETPKAPATPPAEAPKAGVAPPEGMREQYSKGKKNPIGPSAFNHLANNLGLEKAIEVWESTYGKKNVPYEQYMDEYSKAAGKQMVGPKQPLPPGAKPGGSFGTPKYIPDYIKGGATPGGMTAAGGAALGALIAKPSIENAIQSAKEGDTAMSASYLSNLLDFHPVTAIANALFGLSPDELKTLRNAKQAQTVGGGRGVAPPSAYRR